MWQHLSDMNKSKLTILKDDVFYLFCWAVGLGVVITIINDYKLKQANAEDVPGVEKCRWSCQPLLLWRHCESTWATVQSSECTSVCRAERLDQERFSDLTWKKTATLRCSDWSLSSVMDFKIRVCSDNASERTLFSKFQPKNFLFLWRHEGRLWTPKH